MPVPGSSIYIYDHNKSIKLFYFGQDLTRGCSCRGYDSLDSSELAKNAYTNRLGLPLYGFIYLLVSPELAKNTFFLTKNH